MRRVSVVSSLTVAAAVAAAPAWAHHGKDFLVVESAELPHPGQLYFFSSQDAWRDEGTTTLEVSPALLFGVSRALAVELHGHVQRADGSWGYEATAPALRLQLPGSGPLRLGLNAEYEIAREQGAPDHLEARLVAGYRRGRGLLALNVVAEHALGEDEPTEWTYAAAFRPNIESRLGWGIEAQGGLRHREGHEVLLGLYAEPSARLTLKLGFGKGLGSGPDWTVRSGVVFRF